MRLPKDHCITIPLCAKRIILIQIRYCLETIIPHEEQEKPLGTHSKEGKIHDEDKIQTTERTVYILMDARLLSQGDLSEKVYIS